MLCNIQVYKIRYYKLRWAQFGCIFCRLWYLKSRPDWGLYHDMTINQKDGGNCSSRIHICLFKEKSMLQPELHRKSVLPVIVPNNNKLVTTIRCWYFLTWLTWACWSVYWANFSSRTLKNWFVFSMWRLIVGCFMLRRPFISVVFTHTSLRILSQVNVLAIYWGQM